MGKASLIYHLTAVVYGDTQQAKTIIEIYCFNLVSCFCRGWCSQNLSMIQDDMI